MERQSKYRGIVIQNNDPTGAGRVKVFVPGINLTQSKNWNQKKEEDKHFKVLGENTNSSITPEILQTQKEKIMWAEVMLPIMGMSAPGFYHAPSDTYYIGNDSDYLFQAGNKTPEFFRKDAADAERRKNQPIQNPNYGIAPRTDILLNFPNCGQKYCVNSGCSDASVPAFWKNGNGPIDPIVNQIPKTYVPTTLVLDPEDVDENTSVVGVELEVFNPEIFLNDKPVPPDSPLYNRDCFVAPDVDDIVPFLPPIFFEDATEGPIMSYSKIPVSLSINGKQSLTDSFLMDSYDSNSITYKQDNLKVKVPKKNVSSIKVKHNSNRFDFNRIASLLPLLMSVANAILMPRAPASNGQEMQSRGGGGGEIYNNVTTSLIPSFQRKDMHVGGANNESRYTVNYGRKPINDPNNTKGANIQGKLGQIHRGPMRSPDYNNDWKGMILTPAVGAHVWVRFENGDTNYPIIEGTFASQASYKGIFERE